MSVGDGGAAAATAEPEPPTVEVGLWSVRWFRVLTLVNTGAVVVSACLWAAQLGGVLPSPAMWLMFVFPVVPATAAAPVVSAIIVGSAAALSALNMFGERQKAVRFIRAMTVWGTIALGAPAVLLGAWMLSAAVGGL